MATLTGLRLVVLYNRELGYTRWQGTHQYWTPYISVARSFFRDLYYSNKQATSHRPHFTHFRSFQNSGHLTLSPYPLTDISYHRTRQRTHPTRSNGVSRKNPLSLNGCLGAFGSEGTVLLANLCFLLVASVLPSGFALCPNRIQFSNTSRSLAILLHVMTLSASLFWTCEGIHLIFQQFLSHHSNPTPDQQPQSSAACQHIHTHLQSPSRSRQQWKLPPDERAL